MAGIHDDSAARSDFKTTLVLAMIPHRFGSGEDRDMRQVIHGNHFLGKKGSTQTTCDHGSRQITEILSDPLHSIHWAEHRSDEPIHRSGCNRLKIGGRRDTRSDSRPHLLEHRKNITSKSTALGIRIRITRIITPSDVGCTAKIRSIISTDTEQRSDEGYAIRESPRSRHPGEASGPCPPTEGGQDRFELVLCMMTRCDKA